MGEAEETAGELPLEGCERGGNLSLPTRCDCRWQPPARAAASSSAAARGLSPTLLTRTARVPFAKSNTDYRA